MYTLVSAPVLGFDLARLEGGPATAGLLLAALGLTAEDLPVLSERLAEEPVRAALWQSVDAAADRRPSVADQARLPAAELAQWLRQAPIGNLNGLLHCLRYDVLDWLARDARLAADQAARRAVAVLADAAAGSYLREELPDEVRRGLAAGWVAASRRLPLRPADYGPQHRSVAGLLDRIRGTASRHAGQLVAGWADGWSAAMHSASWAVYLSGRLRPAAAAQFALVEALDTARVPVPDRAAGAWNTLSGAVQALVVRDVADTATVHRLLAPYLAAFGPANLR